MIVNLQGGIGNQLHQFAFGRSVSLARGEELFFDATKCRSEDQYSYSLDAFDIEVPMANGRTGPVRGEPVFKYDPTVYTEPNGLYWNGYWQTELYFNVRLLRKELKFKIQPRPIAMELAEEIKKGPSAFAHHRGGDYLREPHKSFHGQMPVEYYREGVKRIRAVYPDCKFYVFSDDMPWCRENFPGEFTFVEGTNKYEDMWLMSQIQHAIIANSSFSWWGCWLNDELPNRIVIAPKKWFASPSMCYQDVVPERWTKI